MHDKNPCLYNAVILQSCYQFSMEFYDISGMGCNHLPLKIHIRDSDFHNSANVSSINYLLELITAEAY